jgi:hypothetical protein
MRGLLIQVLLYFLSIAEKINVNITHSNTNRHTINNCSLQCMSEIFKTSYPNIKCKPTWTKEIENIIKSLKIKNSHGYDEISTTVLKNKLSLHNFTLKLHM